MTDTTSASSNTRPNVEEALEWFARHGATDHHYLRAHFPRFARTYQFGGEGLPPRSEVLDIGCHWLHQAWFFARAGHKVTCADAPNTLRLPSVQSAAAEYGIDLVSYTRIDLGQGLADLPDDAFDLVVFAEIIEHLAFNPLVFWKQVYRVLRPGGRIIVTTPNSLYYRSVFERLQALVQGARYGVQVDEILQVGTYGHHWKEFSLAELRRYFALMSEDFAVERHAIETFGRSVADERAEAAALARAGARAVPAIDMPAVFAELEAAGHEPFGSQMLLDVSLREKRAGITLSPPWLVE
jgi:2-polyprenyl-3-methyl-5-hydroxy-6-metoxy-1,4-benzoquinol methylase